LQFSGEVADDFPMVPDVCLLRRRAFRGVHFVPVERTLILLPEGDRGVGFRFLLGFCALYAFQNFPNFFSEAFTFLFPPVVRLDVDYGHNLTPLDVNVFRWQPFGWSCDFFFQNRHIPGN